MLKWHASQQFLIAAGGGVKVTGVAGYLPNLPETLIAMLAATALGAIWSSASPDFGVQGVLDPLRPDRAQGADLRRWLLVQRQAGRLPGEECRSGGQDAPRC